MSNNATGWQTVHPSIAYPIAQREMHAEQHILISAAQGWLETTQSAHVARTYGLPPSFVQTIKSWKAKHRNELSFAGGDK